MYSTFAHVLTGLQAIEETRNVIVIRNVIVYRIHPRMHSENNQVLRNSEL